MCLKKTENVNVEISLIPKDFYHELSQHQQANHPAEHLINPPQGLTSVPAESTVIVIYTGGFK